MRRLGLIVVMLAIGLVIGGYVFFNGERKIPVRYRTAPVERGSIVSIITATGTVNPITTVQVGSQVSGMIETLHADFNSKVKAGQVVARIDPFPYRARRDQAEATLANANASVTKARTDLAQRKREMDRAKALVGQQFVSQNEMDVALTAYEGAVAQLKLAEAAVKQAAAALEAAELDLKYTVIRSPVDGVVISRQVEVGQRISATFSIPTLFLIAEDVTKMQVDTNVSEADIGGVTEGKEAAFTVDAYPGEMFQGKVRQVRNAPINIQNVVTYDVVVEVENPNFRLKPGMTANVSIVVARRDDVLKLPNAALRFTPVSGRATLSSGKPDSSLLPLSADPSVAASLDVRVKPVWMLDAEGDPVNTHVQVGISDGLFTEAGAGRVKEGDQVIVGIEVSRAERKGGDLPPGFGSGQQRPSRKDRGI
jgi:HlyD family secretion protein